MRKTKTGWVAQRKNGGSWTDPDEDVQPDGIYLYFGGAYATLQYAGTDSDQMLRLPPKPHLLRELAQALTEAADRFAERRSDDD